jgi:hypothetical protein
MEIYNEENISDVNHKEFRIKKLQRKIACTVIAGLHNYVTKERTMLPFRGDLCSVESGF